MVQPRVQVFRTSRACPSPRAVRPQVASQRTGCAARAGAACVGADKGEGAPCLSAPGPSCSCTSGPAAALRTCRLNSGPYRSARQDTWRPVRRCSAGLCRLCACVGWALWRARGAQDLRPRVPPCGVSESGPLRGGKARSCVQLQVGTGDPRRAQSAWVLRPQRACCAPRQGAASGKPRDLARQSAGNALALEARLDPRPASGCRGANRRRQLSRGGRR